MTEQALDLEHYNLVHVEDGLEVWHGDRQPAFARQATYPPLATGDRINLPFGVEGEEFRSSGYPFVIEAIRDDGSRYKTLVLRRDLS